MIYLQKFRFFPPATHGETAFPVQIFKKYCGLWNVSHRVGLSAYSSCPPSAFLSRRNAFSMTAARSYPCIAESGRRICTAYPSFVRVTSARKGGGSFFNTRILSENAISPQNRTPNGDTSSS